VQAALKPVLIRSNDLFEQLGEVVRAAALTPEDLRPFTRCLRCNENTVFDTSKCVACNGCVDVCPENLIRLVGLSKLIEDEAWLEKAIEEFGDIRAIPPEQLDQMGAVMMKDETSCIRCAMCASRCPTHAILMKHFEFHRECVTVPARNPKVLYA
jgi:ferredoxin